MRVFIDANVIMDVLLKRPDFMQDSMDVIQMGIDKDIELFASPLTFATCHYLLRKEIGKENALKALQSIKSFIELTMMDDKQGASALFSEMPDFEDMLQFESAIAYRCDIIVTRNGKHFPKNVIPVLTPSQFLARYTK